MAPVTTGTTAIPQQTLNLDGGRQTIGNVRAMCIPIFAAAVLLLATAVRGMANDDAQASPTWQYGAFADLSYAYDPNDPSNHLFRSRGTMFHVNEADLNMAAVYLKKTASENARWGTELTLQTGEDSKMFGFSATAPNMGEAHWLRHLGPTNASYLTAVGNGLTVQGGIFSSFIGYDSLYAKDNFECTRPWGADFTPYLMLGVNATYPFTKNVSGSLLVVNGYWHLAHANEVPSVGGQIALQPSGGITLKSTLLAGPHQTETSGKFWRYLSDSIVEIKRDRFTGAFEAIAGTERVAAGDARALWIAGQLPLHCVLHPRFSVTVRPEVYWDRDGRTTGFRQTVKANTTTLEYRIPHQRTTTMVRLEHRIDDSRGPDGGFFKDGEVPPGVPALTPTQNLLILEVILEFSAPR